MSPTDDDLALALRSFQRVQDAIGRAVALKLFPDCEVEALGRQLWAVVHGLASLELAGCLGDPDEAARHWHDTTETHLLGYTGQTG